MSDEIVKGIADNEDLPANGDAAIVDEAMLAGKGHIIRGQKVMLDFDLAEIYGYTTKAFNQQVKNNIDKFDGDFRFQLSDEDTAVLSRSKKLTLNKSGRGSNFKYNPYAFTEQGLFKNSNKPCYSSNPVTRAKAPEAA